MPKQTVKDIDLAKEITGAYSTDEKTVKWVNDMVGRAKAVQSQKHSRWDENLKLYKGEHWEDEWLPDYRAQVVDNKIFANIESALPIITDNRPTCDLEARTRSDVETVDKLDKMYRQRWEELTLDMSVVSVTKEMMLDGEAYWKIFWNPALKNGMGDVDVEIVNNRCVFPDPDSTDPLMRDARYVAYESLESLIDLKLWFPKKAKKLQELWDRKQEKKEDKRLQQTTGSTPYSMRTREAVDEGETGGGSSYGSTADGYKRAHLTGAEKLRYREVWIDDKTMITEYPEFIIIMDDALEEKPELGLSELNEYSEALVEQLEDAGLEQGSDFFKTDGSKLDEYGYENVENTYREYPHGRLISICEDILLKDDEWPYEHGRSPYIRFFRYHIPGTGDFFGEPDQIKSMNKRLNKQESQITDIMSITGNPPMIVNVNSGVDTNSITNEPGLIIPVYSDVRAAAMWLQPPNIPAAMFEEVAMNRDNIDDISGIHDVTRGKRPVGLTSGVAIETLQEAAQTRLRLAARHLEWSLKKATELMIAIMWQFYAEERTARYRTADGLQFKQVDLTQDELVGGLPEVRIVRGSTMQTNKGVLKQQSLELFAAGAIDREALLDIFEFPNREAILQRMGGGNPSIEAQQAQPM